MTDKPRTRKPTSAERHAARAAGEAEPAEVEVPVVTSAERHLARLEAREGFRPTAA
ncbi:hypothetical protein AB0J30_08885 [Streptomyces microflavus]|uniref:hypothetical protein n=1 Tax=Streptomyces microflavus TaxID=1919 RepID=UPI00343C47D3